jgi:eukaryotic translation initiation factor 2C
VTRIENDWMKANTGVQALANLNLHKDFPLRPGYGTQGIPIVVYANYYELVTKPELALFRYHVAVDPVGGAPKPSKKKMNRLFQLLLEDPRFQNVKTDYKALVVSSKRLPDMPVDIVIPFRSEGEDEASENAHNYRYSIQETGTIPVASLIQYLQSTAAGVPVFSQRDEIIQCLNAVLGHYAHSNPGIAAIGQNKYFSLDRNPANFKVLGGGLEALRGFIKSVRTGTSRILLNVNVSHAVCYESVKLDVLMKKFGTANKAALTKYLKYVRIQRIHLPVKKNKAGSNIPNVKTIWDLATTNDGFDSEHPPQVLRYGAGPKDVKFFLNDTSLSKKASKKPAKQDGGGRYISVYDYFTQSRSSIIERKLPSQQS